MGISEHKKSKGYVERILEFGERAAREKKREYVAGMVSAYSPDEFLRYWEDARQKRVHKLTPEEEMIIRKIREAMAEGVSAEDILQFVDRLKKKGVDW